MHKVFLFAPLFFFLSTAANDFYNQLSTAIKTSNIETVETLLGQKKLTANEANRFYALATEIVEFYKNPHIMIKDVKKLKELRNIFSGIALMSASFSFLGILLSMSTDFKDKSFFCMAGSAICILITICCKIISKECNESADELFEELLNNSITVKSLLADQIDIPITQRNN